MVNNICISHSSHNGESDVQGQLIYKVVIWVLFGISLWKEKVALIHQGEPQSQEQK